MSDEEIQKLAALARDATPGEWRVDPVYKADVQTNDGGLEIASTSDAALHAGEKPGRRQQNANAAFIAAMNPAAALELIEEVISLRAAVAKVEAA